MIPQASGPQPSFSFLRPVGFARLSFSILQLSLPAQLWLSPQLPFAQRLSSLRLAFSQQLPSKTS
jgi:hypothetical protein